MEIDPHLLSDSAEWTAMKRDPLTGLGTLVAMFETIEIELQSARSAGQPVSLLHIDIDHLGRMNSRLGQVIVDEMLRHLASALRQQIETVGIDNQSDDRIFRIGGDEFAVLLPGVALDTAGAIAEAIRDQCANDSGPGDTLGVTVSIGVASVPDCAFDLGSLITAADVGVLEAKRAGRNAIRVLRKEDVTTADGAVSIRIINTLARRMIETNRLLEEAQRVAFTDAVSGLPNQRAMNQFLQREHQRAVRYRRCYSLLLVDGDSLKRINDALGHEAGNEWIRRLSQVLVRGTRTTDLVARWFSGDEFVIVLTETDARSAFLTAERIRAEVERLGQEMPIAATVSIGIASYPGGGESVKEMLEHADHANGEAKRRGRNRVVAYSEMHPEIDAKAASG